jgi:hypothetical protein
VGFPPASIEKDLNSDLASTSTSAEHGLRPCQWHDSIGDGTRYCPEVVQDTVHRCLWCPEPDAVARLRAGASTCSRTCTIGQLTFCPRQRDHLSLCGVLVAAVIEREWT